VQSQKIQQLKGFNILMAVGLVCLLLLLCAAAFVPKASHLFGARAATAVPLWAMLLAMVSVAALGTVVLFLQRRCKQLEAEKGEDNHAALHDAMTGAANRRQFEQVLDQLTADNTPEHALLMIDLDRFKPVNDLYGHAAGDALLQGISNGLEKVGTANDLVARLGGDEFAMLLKKTNKKAAANTALAALHFVTKYRLNWEGQRISVGASIGLVQIDRKGLTQMNLLTAADEALYAAKEAGRGAVFAATLNKDTSKPPIIVRVDAGTPKPVSSDKSHEPSDGRQQELLAQEMACLTSPDAKLAGSNRQGSRRRHEIAHWINAEPQTIGDAMSPGMLVRELIDDATARSDGGADFARWVLIMAIDAASRFSPSNLNRIGFVLPIPARAVVVVPNLAEELMRLNAMSSLPIRHLTFVLHNVAPVYESPALAEFHERLKASDVRLGFEIRSSTLDVLAPLRTVAYDELHLGRELTKNVQPGTSGRAAVEGLLNVAEQSGAAVVASGVSSVEDVRQLGLMGVDRFYGPVVGPGRKLDEVLHDLVEKRKAYRRSA